MTKLRLSFLWSGKKNYVYLYYFTSGLIFPYLRLQMVQKSAARLLTGSKKYEHIPPVLALLHKLSVILESSLRFCWLFLRLLMGRSQFISPISFVFYQLPGLSGPLAKICHMTQGHVSNKRGWQSLCSHCSTVLESVSHKKVLHLCF